MTRRRLEWRFGQRRLLMGERTLLAGMIELTPQHPGGLRQPLSGEQALARALQMEQEGADLLLFSADAWLPGVPRITETEELRRLSPVWKRVRDQLAVPWGVATEKSQIAERAFHAGAEVIFDPGGLISDPQLAKIVARYDGGLILGYCRGSPETWPKLPPVRDPMPSILRSLDAGLGRARRSHVLPESLIADPGLGCGMRREQNVEVIAHLGALAQLDVPLSVGTVEPAAATLAALAARQGAHLIRTREVAAVRTACDWADAILDALTPKAAGTSDSSVFRAARPTSAR